LDQFEIFEIGRMVGHQVSDQGSGLSHTGSQENAHSGFKFGHYFFGRYRQFLPLRMLTFVLHLPRASVEKVQRFRVQGSKVQAKAGVPPQEDQVSARL
jgi:hypothetical protein